MRWRDFLFPYLDGNAARWFDSIDRGTLETRDDSTPRTNEANRAEAVFSLSEVTGQGLHKGLTRN